MATKYNVTDGNDTFTLASTPETINAVSGSDTFIINGSSIRNFVIDGGTNATGDAVVKPAYFDAAGTKLSTIKTTLGTPNAVDSIKINKTGNFTALNFTHIERIDLADGVTATFTSGQLDDAIGSLGQNGDNATGFNPGLHFYGVAGGKTEQVKVVVEYQDKVFTPAATVVNAKPVTYSMGDFQLDDASTGDLFHNVLHYDDFAVESDENSYARADGSNNDDYGLGSNGVDNATLRLGNDTYFGGAGNDLLIGHQGADYLDGGADDDIFLITNFGGVLGAAGKADDGNPEWISGGDATKSGKGDVIVGGSGIDALRITGGAAEKTTVTLTDKNFTSMEVVQVGGTVGRLNVEDAALQLLNNHYYHDAAGLITGKDLRAGQTADNVIVDANAIKAHGLTFIGNANTNTFIGTQKADTFIGNAGNDTFTGGAGADKFVFGKVHSQAVSGDATTIQTYQDVVSDLTGIDTITDFKSGTDKMALNLELFNIGTNPTIKINPAYYLSFDNGYLSFDKATHTLSFDADGNGAGNSVALVVLTGVSNLTASDFIAA